MTIVAGVDFGTLSVRVSILSSERGRLSTALAKYPLHRKREDPDYATQSHADHMRGLAEATREAVKAAGISGDAGGGHCAGHDGIERSARGRADAAAERVLLVVRPSRHR